MIFQIYVTFYYYEIDHKTKTLIRKTSVRFFGIPFFVFEKAV